jgi:phenylacetate-CoA ligase
MPRPDIAGLALKARLLPPWSIMVEPVQPTTPHKDRRPLLAIQEQKFAALVREILASNPFYSKKCERAGLNLETAPTLEHLAHFPFTTKAEILDDQRRHQPYGTNFTYGLTRYIRMHQTSGTTAVPLRWLDTPESWSWLLDCWQLIYDAVGLKPRDRLFFPFSFGPFIGFWGAFEGALRRGNFCLSGGGMTSRARLDCIFEHRITFVACTPTYALRLAEVAQQEGRDLRSSAVRGLIVAGEPGGNIPTTRARIEAEWDARVYDHTGMTEIGASGIECREAPGGVHILEPEIIPEIIDLQTTAPVPCGSVGELVLTNLGRRGSPLIRYRTGDLVQASTQPCPCGRNWLRLEKGILGRADDMLLIRGNNVYPSAMEEVIRRHREVAEFRIEVNRARALPQVRIEVEPWPGTPTPQRLADEIRTSIKDTLLFQPEVSVVPPETLPRFELKANRFIRRDQE